VAVFLLVSPVRADRDSFEDQSEFAPITGGLYLSDIVEAGSEPELADIGQYPRPVDRMQAEGGASVGLRLTRHLSRTLSVEALWAYTFSELKRTGDSPIGTRTVVHDRLGIVEAEAALLVHPMWFFESRVGPFLRVGGGRLSLRPSNDFPQDIRPVSTRRTAAWMIAVGGGVVAYPTEDLSLRAEYGYSTASIDRDALLGLAFPFPEIGKDTVGGHRFRVGIGLRFFDTNL
jgi:opacity protein-like surface antigen